MECYPQEVYGRWLELIRAPNPSLTKATPPIASVPTSASASAPAMASASLTNTATAVHTLHYYCSYHSGKTIFIKVISASFPSQKLCKQRNILYCTFFEGKTLKKLWLSFDKRAELDLRLTKIVLPC